jgi:LPXTG-motif cell wall-anchored protein
MAAFRHFASIPDVLQIPDAVAIFKHLDIHPIYSFHRHPKILGVVAFWFGFQRLKEWAYAGLVFDLIGALYSHISGGDPPRNWLFAIIGLLLVSASYVFYRKKTNLETLDLLVDEMALTHLRRLKCTLNRLEVRRRR